MFLGFPSASKFDVNANPWHLNFWIFLEPLLRLYLINALSSFLSRSHRITSFLYILGRHTARKEEQRNSPQLKAPCAENGDTSRLSRKITRHTRHTTAALNSKVARSYFRPAISAGFQKIGNSFIQVAVDYGRCNCSELVRRLSAVFVCFVVVDIYMYYIGFPFWINSVFLLCIKIFFVHYVL